MKKIIVKDLIKSDSATSPEKAEPLYNALVESVNNEEKVSVDFSNLVTITTAFFNSSIGKLYSTYSADTLNKFIKLDGKTLTTLQFDKLKLVMQNAKSKLSENDIQEEID
ncbi:STAS-like domain-containing protein [Limosilactobacillus mucosae]|uniref:STAS-like domain-containing protein n=1 Tax=Limosilactobacillus mucosae TaxID=97478 RepID=A0AAJ1M941_LIMMU|nr:STAS-like domain-containing protein [Limosilactobacillus mucosae]MDC2829947.1 STAS-like domain-containing protein [Limosilactobacillus mucosae]MDC2837404.1 STAS-like domain-containing protein [Limosilactobacillus mucosae]MDC2848751.1 STAS-like domain-containing protein [Limosilactobacillus mucosae]MDC2853671.1 STAS-like domain-containing protein [Limosilactobacillus mucosae]